MSDCVSCIQPGSGNLQENVGTMQSGPPCNNDPSYIPAFGRPVMDGLYATGSLAPACQQVCINGKLNDPNFTLGLGNLGANFHKFDERGIELYENFGLDTTYVGTTTVNGPTIDWFTGGDLDIEEGTPINSNYKTMQDSLAKIPYQVANDVDVNFVTNGKLVPMDPSSTQATYFAYRQRFSATQQLGRKVSVFGNTSFSVYPVRGSIPVAVNNTMYDVSTGEQKSTYYSNDNGYGQGKTSGLDNLVDTGFPAYDCAVIDTIHENSPNMCPVPMDSDGNKLLFLTGWVIMIKFNVGTGYDYFGDSGIEIYIPSQDNLNDKRYRIAKSNTDFISTLQYLYQGETFTFSYYDESSQTFWLDAGFYALEPGVGIIAELDPKQWN